jgi:hypothetical protein
VANPYRLRHLAAKPLVAAPGGSSTRGLLDDALRAVGATANVVVEAAQREALLAADRLRCGGRAPPTPSGRTCTCSRLCRGRAAATRVEVRSARAPPCAAHPGGRTLRRARPP